MTDQPENTPADTQWTGPWQWWAGANEEWMTIGPCDTRQQAIDEAVQDGFGEIQGEDGAWRNAFYVCEARQDPLRLANWIGADTALERADEDFANNYHLAEEDLGPWFEATAEQEADLCGRLRKACDEWQRDHNLRFHTPTFSASRNGEFIITDALRALSGGRDG